MRNAWFPGGSGWKQRTRFPNGTYDWTEVTMSYSTGANETSYAFTLLSENTGTVWIDDVSMTADGSATNLLKNSSFETTTQAGSNPEWRLSTSKLRSSVLDVLENAESNDIAVNLLLSPHYFPAWAMTKWPELATSNSGGIKYSIDDPIARDLIEDYVRVVVDAVKSSPALHSITISNEPTYQASKDPNAVQDWTAYLVNAYPDISALNDAYGSAYAQFDEVPMPSGVTADLRSYDYVQFNSDRFAAWHEWIAGIIEDEAPGLAAHAKMMADPTGSLSWGIDVERMSSLGSMIGDDNWNYIDEGATGFYEELSFYDMQQSFAEGPIFNSEQHVIADGDQYYGPEQADHVRSVLWQSAIHGRSASTMWIWERTYDSSSSREGSILHRPDVVESIGETNLDLNRLAGEITAFQEQPSRVAILYSVASAVLTPESNAVTQRAYEALTTSGIEVDYVSEAQIAAGGLSDYDLLVVPATSRVESETFEAVDAYTLGGGDAMIIGSHALEVTPSGALHPSSVRQALLARSEYVSSSATTTATLRASFAPVLDRLFPDRVRVTDASGTAVTDVEWRSVVKDGRRLVNVVNYGDTPIDVSFVAGGEELAVAGELITDQHESSDSMTLQPLTPYLLEVDRVETGGLATAAPGVAALLTDNWDGDGDYAIEVAMWWGENAQTIALRENGVEIDRVDVADATPAAQRASFAVAGRQNGSYRYEAVLANRFGETTSTPLIVIVEKAAPGVPVLSRGALGDGGELTVTMNMWWGTNATEYRLYSDDVLIDQQTLTPDGRNAQTARTVIRDLLPGRHEFVAELVNAVGATRSQPLIVTVD